MSPIPARSAPARASSAALVLFALAMGGFAIGTTEFASMALLPYFSEHLGVNAVRAAEAISAYALGVVVGAPVLAVVCAGVSKKRLLIVLMLAFAVFNGLSAVAPTFELFVASRALAGLPHGAYFGVAALVAAGQVPANKRSTAISRIFLGLTAATMLGVPLANVLGQTVGWRWGFAIVSLLAASTAGAIALFAPLDRPDRGANPLRELAALKNSQVLLTLATGAIGFGGFFAVYTYIASTLAVTMGAPAAAAPVALFVTGLGMTIGTFVSGWAADRNQTRAAFAMMGGAALALLFYPTATGAIGLYMATLFVLGATTGLATVLQARLMDVAGDAQQLAAALNHSAFNTANALGPFLASMAVAAGFGFPATGYVGACLTIAGMGVFTLTLLDARRLRRTPVAV